jgi:bacterioferritin (cytochrome b1)
MSDTAAVITEQQLDVLYNCIAKLEAALRQQGPMRVTYSVELLEATINKQVERIEALEAALRLIDNVSTDYVAIKIARGTLASERTASEYEEIFAHLGKNK